ncbi:uncharacterized protein V6R79_015535 [Siganus canaliculatus]
MASESNSGNVDMTKLAGPRSPAPNHQLQPTTDGNALSEKSTEPSNDVVDPECSSPKPSVDEHMEEERDTPLDEELPTMDWATLVQEEMGDVDELVPFEWCTPTEEERASSRDEEFPPTKDDAPHRPIYRASHRDYRASNYRSSYSKNQGPSDHRDYRSSYGKNQGPSDHRDYRSSYSKNQGPSNHHDYRSSYDKNQGLSNHRNYRSCGKNQGPSDHRDYRSSYCHDQGPPHRRDVVKEEPVRDELQLEREKNKSLQHKLDKLTDSFNALEADSIELKVACAAKEERFNIKLQLEKETKKRLQDKLHQCTDHVNALKAESTELKAACAAAKEKQLHNKLQLEKKEKKHLQEQLDKVNNSFNALEAELTELKVACAAQEQQFNSKLQLEKNKNKILVDKLDKLKDSFNALGAEHTQLKLARAVEEQQFSKEQQLQNELLLEKHDNSVLREMMDKLNDYFSTIEEENKQLKQAMEAKVEQFRETMLLETYSNKILQDKREKHDENLKALKVQHKKGLSKLEEQCKTLQRELQITTDRKNALTDECRVLREQLSNQIKRTSDLMRKITQCEKKSPELKNSSCQTTIPAVIQVDKESKRDHSGLSDKVQDLQRSLELSAELNVVRDQAQPLKDSSCAESTVIQLDEETINDLQEDVRNTGTSHKVEDLQNSASEASEEMPAPQVSSSDQLDSDVSEDHLPKKNASGWKRIRHTLGLRKPKKWKKQSH